MSNMIVITYYLLNYACFYVDLVTGIYTLTVCGSARCFYVVFCVSN